MRRLLVVRHAKAKRDSPRGDHGRVLAHRGREQALVLRSWTDDGGPLSSLRATVVVSDAARTLETFELGLAGTPVCRRGVVDPLLYNGRRHVSTDDVLAALAAADPGVGDLAVVLHNPTVAELTADLADDGTRASELLRGGFPLGGAALLRFDAPAPGLHACALEALLDPEAG